jgi:hypothetical protein
MKRVLQRLLLDLLLGIAHDLEHIDIDRQGLRKRMEIKPGAAKPGQSLVQVQSQQVLVKGGRKYCHGTGYAQDQKNSLKRGNSACRDTGHYRNETTETNKQEKTKWLTTANDNTYSAFFLLSSAVRTLPGKSLNPFGLRRNSKKPRSRT